MPNSLLPVSFTVSHASAALLCKERCASELGVPRPPPRLPPPRSRGRLVRSSTRPCNDIMPAAWRLQLLPCRVCVRCCSSAPQTWGTDVPTARPLESKEMERRAKSFLLSFLLTPFLTRRNYLRLWGQAPTSRQCKSSMFYGGGKIINKIILSEVCVWHSRATAR